MKAPRTTYRSVADKLVELDALDARLREDVIAHGFADRRRSQSLRAFNAASLRWLEDVLDELGWPSRKKVGARASNAAWRMVQHAAPAELALQQRCLRLIRAQARRGNTPWRHAAYLTDAISLRTQRAQIFGTQFRKQKGELVPWPILRVGAVDNRRRRMGLPSLATYSRRLREHFAPALRRGRSSRQRSSSRSW